MVVSAATQDVFVKLNCSYSCEGDQLDARHWIPDKQLVNQGHDGALSMVRFFATRSFFSLQSVPIASVSFEGFSPTQASKHRF